MPAEFPENTAKKAELIEEGSIFIPKNVPLPCFPSRSTAGPGAGSASLIFSFGNSRVKLGISKEPTSMFTLENMGNGAFKILKNGKVFIDCARIVPALLHAPNQAFINLEHKCIYNCRFCASPRLEKHLTKDMSPDKAANMILKASKNADFESVAITSGIRSKVSESIEEIISLIKRVKDELPEVPIGVEPYVMSIQEIEELYDAGAAEIKINIQSYDRYIFRKICPEMDFDTILDRIKDAVDIFGKGKVCSNIIIGLGETDENVLSGVEDLAEIGAVATLRAIRINDYNYAELVKALGNLEPVRKERLLRLAAEHKKILEKHSLTTETFRTMCHRCGCCDIVPFVDV